MIFIRVLCSFEILDHITRYPESNMPNGMGEDMVALVALPTPAAA
jgi:hypothetical protein